MIDLLKKAMTLNFRRATSSAQLYKRPCFLISANLVAGAGGAATATLYDGHTTNGDVILDLSAPASTADDRTFPFPIYCDQGLYASLGSNVTSVIVQLRHARDLGTPKRKRSKK